MAEFADWGAILPDAGMPLPLADDPDFVRVLPCVVRGCFIRLADVAHALAKREDAAAPVAIFADVLRIEGALSIVVSGLTLHARRLEVGADASLELRTADASKPGCRLDLHVDEWAFGGVRLALPLTIGGVPHDLTAGPAGGGIEARVADDGSVDLREVGTATDGDALTGQIELDTARRLACCPQLGTAWSHTLPLQMADWVARTGRDPLLRSDARAFAAHLRTPRGHQHFVPYLQLADYEELARSTQTALQAVEQEYGRLIDRQLGIDEQKQAAGHLLEHYRAAKAYADKLLHQAQEDMARAGQATELAQQRIDERMAEIEAARKVFEAGIAQKKAELERKAWLNIAVGVLELGAGIALVCVAGPAGVAAAAGGAAAVASAGAKTAQSASRLVKLLETIAKVLDAIKKIQGYYKLLQDMFESIHDPIEARQRAAKAGEKLPSPPGPEDTMGAADWDEFTVTLDASFKPALDQGIAGADDYLVALKKLAIRGKDLVATHTHLDRCQQGLQQCLWQRLRDEDDLADMQARIAVMDERRGPGSVLVSYHARLRDRLKFRLVQAIADVSDAYRYEALAEPAFVPSIASSGADLAAMLAEIQRALVGARERRGPVSDWGPEGPSEQATAPLATLQRTGSMSWALGLENFEGLDRIRVHDIRVWLKGELGVDRFHIEIGTSGSYLDRLRGKRFEFAAWPLQRTFRYQRLPDRSGGDDERDAWGQPVHVTLRANDAEGTYFEPTAFTTWTITLAKDFNRGLDPSRITGVVLEFTGTAMGARPVLRMARGQPQAVLLRKVVTL